MAKRYWVHPNQLIDGACSFEDDENGVEVVLASEQPAGALERERDDLRDELFNEQAIHKTTTQALERVQAERDALAVERDTLRNTVKAEQAKVEAVKAELNETWVDESQTVWTRPTAWAYAMVCKARDKHHGNEEALATAQGRYRLQLKRLYHSVDYVASKGMITITDHHDKEAWLALKDMLRATEHALAQGQTQEGE